MRGLPIRASSKDSPITISNMAITQPLIDVGNGALEFYSAMKRLWKLPANVLELACEDHDAMITTARGENKTMIDATMSIP